MLTTTRPSKDGYDVAIIGAGFYGCSLASHLARSGSRVLICECRSDVMERASAINQARVHTGFHYPRNYVTALRSLHNYQRFADDFAPAIRRDFKMLYAVARRHTKVNARRFIGMFQAMQAPIERANPVERALFDGELIEDAYVCEEFAFDYQILRRLVLSRLQGLPVEIALGTSVKTLKDRHDGICIELEDGSRISASRVFNMTYAHLNTVLLRSGLTPLALKHELVEIALIDPPAILNGIGVTVIDGPFFSTLPWPAAAGYSLTHVRYTPHFGWTDAGAACDPDTIAGRLPRIARWRHMIADAQRFLPAIRHAKWQRSLFEIKTVPIKSEHDDGRPILLHHHTQLSGVSSVLGSKIDNIYDLLEAVG